MTGLRLVCGWLGLMGVACVVAPGDPQGSTANGSDATTADASTGEQATSTGVASQGATSTGEIAGSESGCTPNGEMGMNCCGGASVEGLCCGVSDPCQDSAECCEGFFCHETAGMCMREGGCSDATQSCEFQPCCEGFECNAEGICEPSCGGLGEPCDGATCCNGLSCDDATGQCASTQVCASEGQWCGDGLDCCADAFLYCDESLVRCELQPD